MTKQSTITPQAEQTQYYEIDRRHQLGLLAFEMATILEPQISFLSASHDLEELGASPKTAEEATELKAMIACLNRAREHAARLAELQGIVRPGYSKRRLHSTVEP